MTSKERVLRALKKMDGLPDRVPIQFDLCKQHIEYFAEKLNLEPEYALSYYEDLTYRISANTIRTTMGSDVCVVGGTVASGYSPIPSRDNMTLNEFGMLMKPTNLYVEVVECPLRNVSSEKEIEAYDFPDPYAPGRFDIAEQVIEKFGKDYFVIGDCELTLFELAWHLIDLESYLIALASGEAWVEVLNDRVEYWSTNIALQLIKLGVDAIWMGEDLGTQTSTLISPRMWRKRFKHRYQRMIETFRKENPEIIIIMHSDGAVAPLLHDFIDLGIDVYNPVQPNVPGSDPQELKDKFGDSISFFGGIDQQQLLPKGDPEEIRKEVQRRARILGDNGGYLLAPAHILQADTSPETIELMIEAAKTSG
ncbi:hypothetical protein CSA56_18560 [candidate division KSB3 bacterium]|uniref:Uroporphyrinogen decarboxylase (URO-D) domain-containing protein n=1 Tax=candidate division KSB3 bacterium TaxID=2044937 RepID=A0A2G6K973_9BACT|nr:MAG: hypothetical protein CSA56_18560 [candidate division KSB3 bacterium]